MFGEDLFDLALENTDGSSIHRPPYRWILIGPGRSGTGIHIDPLMTSAWVTLLQGCKRWVLFPPDTDRDLIGLDENEQSIFWFANRYEKIVKGDKMNLGVVEVVQQPGETVYIPGGWPHVVINLELSVAVTHNYAPNHLLEDIWKSLCSEGEGEFAQRWYDGLVKNSRHELISRIDGTGIKADETDVKAVII